MFYWLLSVLSVSRNIFLPLLYIGFHVSFLIDLPHVLFKTIHQYQTIHKIYDLHERTMPMDRRRLSTSYSAWLVPQEWVLILAVFLVFR